MPHVQTERSINWHMGWPDDRGPFPTRMVETIALALQKPARDLDAQEVRLLVSQNLALEYSAPLALQLLKAGPMVSGGAYYGDLLNACLTLEPGFWAQNRSVFIQFRELLSNIRTIDTEINARVDAFLKLEIEPADRAGKAKKTKGTR
jgi:contact-dependent growth inhibition (CDI) system CdiI-like immunity protein